MPKLTDIFLSTTLKERLAQGHPWIYRNHVPTDVRLPSGAWVRVRCGGWSGYGLWDNEGPIAIRVFSTRQVPDARWLHAQVQRAWELRAPLHTSDCTAYRWLFGEGDGLPGLTVDLYDQYAVIQPYMAGASVLLDWLVDALKATTALQGILLRDKERRLEIGDLGATRQCEDQAQSPLSNLWGKLPPDDFTVVEHGVRFYVDLRGGQKTGLFLDHRENRRHIEGLSAGRTVLNCFAYTGAFSLYALRGGANKVVSADIGKGLAQAAEDNIVLNDLDMARHTFITADCFDLLDNYVKQGRQFDMVILDPPSFAKNKQNRFAAVRAYTRLNALAMRCVIPGGLLATASCTSQVGPEAFREMLAAAGANAGRRLQIIHEVGQPLDHPVPAYFPEGRYLKFVVGRVGEEN
jgi:23S rRNA (cytosine1962-C5)-methyltransferase